MASSAITGAIFDCDGTLIGSLEAWRGLEGALADRAGVQVTPAERERFTTFTIPEVSAYFHEHYGLARSTSEVISLVDEYMLGYYTDHASLLPGVQSFLEACAKEGIRMSVASSSPVAYLEAGLKRTGIREYFRAVVSVDDVNASKREPRVYDFARQQMGTSKESTWGFEDSLYAIDTLMRSRYRTVGIFDPQEGIDFRELQNRVDIAVRDFTELHLDRF